jgi:predicted transcriptional regulator
MVSLLATAWNIGQLDYLTRVDLPKQYKMVEPSYQELGPEGYVPHFL